MVSSAKSKGGEGWSVWGDFITDAAGIDFVIPGNKRNALLIFLCFRSFGSGSEHPLESVCEQVVYAGTTRITSGLGSARY